MTTPIPPPPDEPLPDPVPPTRAAEAAGGLHQAGSIRLDGGGAAGGDRNIDPATRRTARAVNRGWYALLLIPFVGLLWLPFYARRTPELFGFPFFYWYQFLWVFIGAGITGLVYALTTTSDAPPADAPGQRPRGGSYRSGRP
jgi:hypothetical protein